MWRALICAGVLIWTSPVPVSAQWIDYGLLFQEHSEDLSKVTADDGSVKTVLEFDTGVRVTRTGVEQSYHYLGEDFSTEGAVGCSFNIVLELRLYSQICPKLIEGLDTGRFENVFQQLNSFVAENGYPAVSEVENATRADAYIRVKKANDVQAMANICVEDKFGELEHLHGFYQGLIDLGESGALKEMLAVPRLPVSNPCL